MKFLNNTMGVVAPIVTGLIVDATNHSETAFLVGGLVLMVGIFFHVIVMEWIEPIRSPQ